MQLLSRILLLVFLFSQPWQVAAAQSDRLGVLKRVGALHCAAILADETAGPPVIELDCELRFIEDDLESLQLSGKMLGSGLYLVDPGVVQVLFSVLAPTYEIRSEAVAGDYDVSTRHDYEVAESDANMLFGGNADQFALQLLAPRVDAINPATRLTLEVEESVQ